MKPKLLAERGQALILIALAAIGLVAITGLAIDGSAKYSDRRHAQNAADTASLAAALDASELMTNGETPSTCSTDPSYVNSAFCQHIIDTAWERAQENGYDGLLSNDVNVYSPPISGPYTTSGSSTIYVQVIITSHVNTWFARILGINQTTNTVKAVAIAGKGGILGDGAMIISYDPTPNCSTGGTGGYSVLVNGSGILNLNGGGIFVNSNQVCGFRAPNCPTINITGGGGINSVGADNIDTQGCTYNPPIKTNFDQDQVAIPTDVSFPSEPAECHQMAGAYNSPIGSDTWHITPGYYIDFPQKTLNGNDPYSLVGNKKNIIMDPGVYCVGSDIKWSGNTFKSLDGSSGVTIYLKSGYTFDFTINSPITLYASHNGSDYDGYLIIQQGSPSSIGSCTINGGSYLDLEGLIYAPYCNITVNGGSEPTATINAQLIGWDIKLNGNNTINFNYNPNNKVKIKRQVGLMQ